MYICPSCGDVTESLPTYFERHPYGDTYACERMTEWECKACRKDEYIRAVRCEECGEWMPEGEGGICGDCENRILTEINSGLYENEVSYDENQ